MKLFLLVVFFIIVLTDAVKVTDEDIINSPLVSYLLAKVHRLEAKMMAKYNVRNTREVEKRSVDSADDKKTKDCPQVVTYIKWGNTTCPYEANTIYKEIAVGGKFDHKGATADMICPPPNPMCYSTNPGGNTWIYAVEYHTSGSINHVNFSNMPCALCEAARQVSKIMIPSHYVCPDGWHKKYNGNIMAGYEGHVDMQYLLH